jgi:hypothetical protein
MCDGFSPPYGHCCYLGAKATIGRTALRPLLEAHASLPEKGRCALSAGQVHSTIRHIF